jgi:nicotinamide-nucleotide amidase
LAYLPGLGLVKLRLSAFGNEYETESQLETEVELWKEKLVSTIPDLIYGSELESLADVIGKMLVARNQRLALAESCTGGFIAHQITLSSGASLWFEGGVVSYSNALKNKLLNVPHDIFETVGAVSPECVAAMAQGARQNLKADIALSVSGILGPDGGTPDKPVGTVYIGISDGVRTETYLSRVARDRSKNIQLGGVYALTFLYRFLRGVG